MKKILLILAMIISVGAYSQTIKEVKIDLSKDSLTNFNRIALASNFFIDWGVSGAGLDTNNQYIIIYYERVLLLPNGKAYKSDKTRVMLKKGTPQFNNFVNSYQNAFTPMIEAIIKENEGLN